MRSLHAQGAFTNPGRISSPMNRVCTQTTWWYKVMEIPRNHTRNQDLYNRGIIARAGQGQQNENPAPLAAG